MKSIWDEFDKLFKQFNKLFDHVPFSDRRSITTSKREVPADRLTNDSKPDPELVGYEVIHMTEQAVLKAIRNAVVNINKADVKKVKIIFENGAIRADVYYKAKPVIEEIVE